MLQVAEMSQNVESLAREVHKRPTDDDKLRLDDQCAKWLYGVMRLGTAVDCAVNPVLLIKTIGERDQALPEDFLDAGPLQRSGCCRTRLGSRARARTTTPTRSSSTPSPSTGAPGA